MADQADALSLTWIASGVLILLLVGLILYRLDVDRLLMYGAGVAVTSVMVLVDEYIKKNIIDPRGGDVFEWGGFDE